MTLKSIIAALGLLAALPAFAQVTTVPNPLATDGRAAPAAQAAPSREATPAAAAKPAAKSGTKSSTSAASPSTQAPGGGAGKVWANSSSKVYHCEGTQYYGKTKKGEYMTEADARAKGFHGVGGKACGAGA